MSTDTDTPTADPQVQFRDDVTAAVKTLVDQLAATGTTMDPVVEDAVRRLQALAGLTE